MKDGRYWRIVPWPDKAGEQHFTLVEEHFKDGLVIHDMRTQMNRTEFEQLYEVVFQALHNNTAEPNGYNSPQ